MNVVLEVAGITALIAFCIVWPPGALLLAGVSAIALAQYRSRGGDDA